MIRFARYLLVAVVAFSLAAIAADGILAARETPPAVETWSV